MIKKFSKKLTLKKETISNLRYGEMNNLKGGATFTLNTCLITCEPCDTLKTCLPPCVMDTEQKTCQTIACYCP